MAQLGFYKFQAVVQYFYTKLVQVGVKDEGPGANHPSSSLSLWLNY